MKANCHNEIKELREKLNQLNDEIEVIKNKYE